MKYDPFSPSSAAKPPTSDVAPDNALTHELELVDETQQPADLSAVKTPPAAPSDPNAPFATATSPDASAAVPDVSEGVGSSSLSSSDTLVVPEGTTKEIMAWVGLDLNRASAALAIERASDEPRKGLTRELEELLRDDRS